MQMGVVRLSWQLRQEPGLCDDQRSSDSDTCILVSAAWQTAKQPHKELSRL